MADAVSVVGFDSAWTDNPKSPGALTIIRRSHGIVSLHLKPTLVSFADALEIIRCEQSEVKKCVVALDQPTIVPNATGSRPVDRVAASLISWIGGGVQPANRSKIGMFDDSAPIWQFKGRLSAEDDPEMARDRQAGLFLLEVFPALALASIEPAFCQRLCAPKYNPAVRKRFQLTAWQSVVRVVAQLGELHAVDGLAEWCQAVLCNALPKKADQDKVDAMICALIGVHWLCAPRSESVIIGGLDDGYMIVPTPTGAHSRLVAAASARRVPLV